MSLINSKPKKDNFIMPGEWNKHDMCWMGFPLVFY